MGKVTIEISNDAAARIAAGIRQVIEGLETVAKGVATLSVQDPQENFPLELQRTVDAYRSKS